MNEDEIIHELLDLNGSGLTEQEVLQLPQGPDDLVALDRAPPRNPPRRPVR